MKEIVEILLHNGGSNVCFACYKTDTESCELCGGTKRLEGYFEFRNNDVAGLAYYAIKDKCYCMKKNNTITVIK